MKADHALAILCTVLCLPVITGTVRGEIVSIKARPLLQGDKTDLLSNTTGTDVSRVSFVGGQMRAGGPFSMADLISRVSFPIVMWSDGNERGWLSYQVKKTQTWRETFDELQPQAGTYQAFSHGGFAEVVWATAEDEQKIRNEIPRSVPPIAFRSRRAADLLTMWHEVSRLDFLYDTDLVRMSNEREDRHEADAKELRAVEGKSEDEDRLAVEFDSPQRLPIAEFFANLAAQLGGSSWHDGNRWVIGRFRRDGRGVSMISSHLSTIREHPRTRIADAPSRTLAVIGPPALPEILSEFGASDGIYRRALTDILVQVTAPERDAAFLEVLLAFSQGRGAMGDDVNVPEIMQALAASDYSPAISLIEQIAKNPSLEEMVRGSAVISLNVLGRPLPATPPEEIVAVNTSAMEGLSIDEVRMSLPKLHSLLDLGPLNRVRHNLLSAGTSENGRITFVLGSGAHSENILDISVLPERNNVCLAVVTHRFQSRSLGAMYARLEKKSGRWLVTKYKLLRIH